MPWLAALSLCLLAACVTPAIDAVQERIDEATGTTITRLAVPVELLAAEPGGRGAGPYAYAAPFETNRMGERRAYLWIAAPASDGAAFVAECGTLAIPVPDAASALQSLGLARMPYLSPAQWYAARVLRIEGAWMACLGSGATFSVTVGGRRFVGDGTRRADLAHFSARVSE
jgi:hypothetical protein